MISAVINTINEEKNITRAINSMKDFADEIVVVDMHSDDETVKIAKKLGAKVYDHERTGYVEPARNFAISRATGDWILILDADEEISKELKQSLKEIVDGDKADYVRIPRKNLIFGKWIKHSRWWPDYNIRFFKAGKVTWSDVIHSIPLTIGRGADLADEEEKAIIHHHYESIEQFVGKLNNYTTQHARNMVKDGYEFKWSDVISKPTAEFVSRFFRGAGYKDGLHGLALAFLQAFSELILYLKVWELNGFKAEDVKLREIVDKMRQTDKEMHYWQADSLIREGAGVVSRIRRKLKV